MTATAAVQLNPLIFHLFLSPKHFSHGEGQGEAGLLTEVLSFPFSATLLRKSLSEGGEREREEGVRLADFKSIPDQMSSVYLREGEEREKRDS